MKKTISHSWLYDLLLIVILVAGASVRLVGLNWDEGQHLHPDERFLTMVESAITPVGSLSEYFDTANSTLNPHNKDFGFFVYGTLPIFITRYAAEALHKADYDGVTLVGRQLSALADLGAIVLMYLIASKLYNRRVALLGAAFSAFSVMLIQQSHFFTVDTFTNFFMFLAIFFAVNIMTDERRDVHYTGDFWEQMLALFKEPLVLNTLAFGVALGMAASSKINAAPLAVLLPGAFIVRWFRLKDQGVENGEQLSADSDSLPVIGGQSAIDNQRSKMSSDDQWMKIVILLFVGAFLALLSFRVFQPYAFRGEFGFLDVRLNDKWVANMKEISAQSSGDVDYPPALQWARRSRLFSFENLTVWGLGLPLGILAWIGFLYMGWRILKGEGKQHALLWGWTLAYFIWQSLQWNSTMRYQLPIYPLLAMMAAWFIFQLADQKSKVESQDDPDSQPATFNLSKILSVIIGGGVLIATALWAFAFIHIYMTPHSRVAAARWIYQNVPGPINLQIEQADGSVINQPLTYPDQFVIQTGAPYDQQFNPHTDGTIKAITFGHAYDPYLTGSQTLTLSLWLEAERAPDKISALATLTGDFAAKANPRGDPLTLTLDRPLSVEKDHTYYFRIETTGSLTLSGAAPINESSWDDGLPLRMDGYDGYGGIYQGGLNLELYWDDNPDKYNRFVTTLDQGEYIFISSNRQWATTTRVPERYPLTTAYYRALIGCPAEKDIIWCYNVAKPGTFTGDLGFELIQVFESFPTLGGFSFNDQFAEEAFSVYDHPKVLLFQKTADYDPGKVRALLGAVDLTQVIHVTPKRAGAPMLDLMLPLDQLASQRAGGTWSELFSYESIQNRYPVVGLVIWYLAILVLGLFAYPLVRLALPGLSDKGYPVSRTVALVLLAYFAWITASLGGEYSRSIIALGCGLIVLAGALAAFIQRDELKAEIKARGRYFLLMEALFLAFFLIDLSIRLGNPDLWHPGKGGERPMDFSYLNAILKSTSFPPYDPWFAGGYINYYYWGFVLVGTPIKLLGIVPSIAYNFVLPTLFAMVGMGAFSVAWNLVSSFKLNVEGEDANLQPSTFNFPFYSGLAASAGMILLGNLGTIRMIFQGFQRITVSYEQAVDPQIGIIQHWAWALDGLAKILSSWKWEFVDGWLTFTSNSLPYGYGDWYWFPSRVIPAPGDVEPITEFPLFTFLYSDLHAHMIVLPLTLFVILWALAIVAGKAKWQNAGAMIWSFVLGGLFIGALRPTNTWDFPTYLALGAIAAVYAIHRNAKDRSLFGLAPEMTRWILAAAGAGALIALAVIFFQPYARWYGLGYGAVEAWKGSHTPIWSYFTQWGVFLFAIILWMGWETREWMAATPLSSLAKLRPYQILIELALALLIITIGILLYLGAGIAWFVIPLAFWALILILRPDQPDLKRAVLFMIGTALVLTLVVELIVLVGDIGRMNTVFKFYLQAWTLFAVSAGAAFGWTLLALPRWSFNWRVFWQTCMYLLFAGAALFTVTGSMDKIRDRFATEAPHTLDSMAYMPYARYGDQGVEMNLDQDYRAIRWMQDHIQGSPVIVEVNCPEYRWCTRFTIYTGLPGVVGWNWHQRQQRSVTSSEWVTDRVAEIGAFYTTTDIAQTVGFLKKYDVKYIIVGLLERAYYPGETLNKFDAYNGQFWTEIYRDGQTVIYEVK
jgi:YYY domain-containing protein